MNVRQRLSDLTDNPEYGDLAQKAESYFFDAAEVWPGLTGSNYSAWTGEVMDEYGGWTGVRLREGIPVSFCERFADRQ